MNRVLAVACIGLALVVASCASNDTSAESTSAAAEEVLDEYLAAWGTDDPDAVVAMFADEFYFKGLGPFEPERLDAASLTSYAEAMVPLRIRMERVGDIAIDESGRISFETTITSDELEGRLASMEAEIVDDRITSMVTLDWEKATS